MGKKHKKHHKSEKTDPEGEKSLKVVLKLGGLEQSATSLDLSDYSPSEKRHKHKKKKKKKSSEREKHRIEKIHDEKEVPDVCIPSVVAERVVETPPPDRANSPRPPKERSKSRDPTPTPTPTPTPPPPKKPRIQPSEFSLDTLLHKQRRGGNKDYDFNKNLTYCLEYLHRILSRKDASGFFQFPVTDIIAPGYSDIINNPMEFSTMKSKIDNGEYNTIMEYKYDFKLMLDNAMLYNKPDTIYYQAARKMLGSGLKHLTHERLLSMKNTLSSMQSLTMADLGFHENDPDDSLPIVEKFKPPKKIKPPKSSKFEAIPDNLSPAEILAQCQAAAAEAAEELTLRQPDSKIGFLRKQKDGTTTLNILNPDNSGIVNEKERVITLGQVVGKLNHGTGQVNPFREDKRNKVTPVNYLDYGPFSSFAPSYDSSFSNLTKEDSDLVLSTYGGELGVQYAESFKRFTADSGEYITRLADGLLNMLTKGEHSKTIKTLEQKRQERESDSQRETDNETSQPVEARQGESQIGTADTGQSQSDLDLNSLRSLKELGIDVSFLDTYEAEMTSNKVQNDLDLNADLIHNLDETHTTRLSQHLPSHLANVQGPGSGEIQLAGKVTKNLTDLVKQVTPGDMTSLQGLHSTMGISMETDHQSDMDLKDSNQPPALTPLSHTADPTDNRDIEDFLSQGPNLRVCDSPSAPQKITKIQQDGISDISSASDTED